MFIKKLVEKIFKYIFVEKDSKIISTIHYMNPEIKELISNDIKEHPYKENKEEKTIILVLKNSSDFA